MFPNERNWSSAGVTDDTVNSLRNRLHAMKEVFGDSEEDEDDARKKRAARRRKKNCIDNIIDGSFMGMILFTCLTVVLGASFLAYKNLYYAMMSKFYPDENPPVVPGPLD